MQKNNHNIHGELNKSTLTFVPLEEKGEGLKGGMRKVSGKSVTTYILILAVVSHPDVLSFSKFTKLYTMAWALSSVCFTEIKSILKSLGRK